MNKIIIFDLDGTLLYTLEDINDAINFALNKYNFKNNTLEETRNFVGNGASILVKRSIYHIKNPILFLNNPVVEQVLDLYNKKYSKIKFNHTRAYDNVIETLKSFKEKGYKLAVLSNKPDLDTKRIIEYYFNGIFDLVEGAMKEYQLKPDKRHVLSIIDRLGCKTCDATFVGDSLTDIKTARNANIRCVSVSYGYVDKNVLRLYNNNIIDNFKDLEKYI